MRVVRQPLEASAARPARQVWLCSTDSKRSMPGRQPRCPTHRPPIQMQQYKQRWSQESCKHPAWPREKRIHWSLLMAHVTVLKQPIARMQYSLGLRCYHLYDSDLLRLHSQPFPYDSCMVYIQKYLHLPLKTGSYGIYSFNIRLIDSLFSPTKER